MSERSGDAPQKDAERVGAGPRAASDEAASKLLWLALRNITVRWTMPVREWKAAMAHFAILYEDRFIQSRG